MLLTGLVGRPVTHSIGQTVYNRFFSLSGIDSLYLSVDVTDENLPLFVTKSKGIFSGYNVTIPHKIGIMQYLDEVERIASDIGAVNLVVNHNDASMGYNTDYMATLSMMRKNAINTRGRKIAVAGSGGVARTILHYLMEQDDFSEITVLSRKPPEAEKRLRQYGRGGDVKFRDYSADTGDYDILVNCTPVGMWPDTESSPFSDVMIENCEAGIDLVYNPEATVFVQSLRNLGKKAVGGLEFFIDQGVESMRLLLDGEFDETLFRKVAAEAAGGR